MGDIEGKVTRVGSRERGQRTSFKLIRSFRLTYPPGFPSMSSAPAISIVEDLQAALTQLSRAGSPNEPSLLLGSVPLLLFRRRLGDRFPLLFFLSRAFGFRLLLCLVLLIRFRRFVAHDEKGSSCNP